uniref:IFT81 calponin homology domain-containing protein n=1 Tax=Oxyrrhis marina TaxID=2969 RepID=A0A7S4GQ01_OXYMA|mmetsp:Transcript_40270/g.96510  ORF Transcript_40270/g.96510 Transcript_40270/m.96510 type:complete len:688 (+) Transcript_40270:43-2106(+)
MASADQLREVVDRLNAEPFNMQLSLVSFDEKQPLELMEVLNGVLIYLDSDKHKVDLRDETPDAMYHRIGEFLHVVGYRCSYDLEFQQGLVTGSKQVVYPILLWLLQNLQQLKKRAYLAKYCVTFEVPEEFLKDDEMAQLFNHYRELQATFKATHSHLEQQVHHSVTPGELKREIQQLDAEKEQLVHKISAFKQKTANQPGFDELLQVTSALRKQQEEDARISERIREQRMQLDQVEQLHMMTRERYAELIAAQNSEDSSAESMLRHLRNDVSRSRDTLTRLQRDAEEKQKRVMQLDEMLKLPTVTQSDIQRLESDVGAVHDQIAQLERTKAENDTTDSRLTIYKQQVNLVAKKKELAEADLKKAEQERETLAAELTQKEKEYEGMKGHKFLNRDEFKQYVNQVREKTQQFKLMKQELSDIRMELHVLDRSAQILQKNDAIVNSHMNEVERAKGIEGYQDTEQEIQDVSAQKAEVDKTKGSYLDQISKTVTDINAQLKDKKATLAPQIKKLRTCRQRFQPVETQYMERREAYQSTKLALDDRLKRLLDEVEALQGDVAVHDQQFHVTQIQSLAVQAQLARAAREQRCANNEEKWNADYQSLSQLYTSEMQTMEQVSKELRKQRQQVQENHDHHLAQKHMFKELEELISCKLKVAEKEAQSMRQSAEDFRAGYHGTAGVDRFVVSDDTH